LLQIFDDGRLTDGQGHIVDFRNTVLIMTSNLGTEYVSKSGSLGFLQVSGDSKEREAQAKIERELKKTFQPEFLNRIDEIITFSELAMNEMLQIVDLQMQEVKERLNEQGLDVRLTDEAQRRLAEVGYNPDFGARPLRRALQKHIESPLSVKLLAGDFEQGDTVVVDVGGEDNSEIVFRISKKQEEMAKETVDA
jgi:ATP-dependent Clp protease ATP-binding subunit ClpC